MAAYSLSVLDPCACPLDFEIGGITSSTADVERDNDRWCHCGDSVMPADGALSASCTHAMLAIPKLGNLQCSPHRVRLGFRLPIRARLLSPLCEPGQFAKHGLVRHLTSHTAEFQIISSIQRGLFKLHYAELTQKYALIAILPHGVACAPFAGLEAAPLRYI